MCPDVNKPPPGETEGKKPQMFDENKLQLKLNRRETVEAGEATRPPDEAESPPPPPSAVKER